MKALIRAGAMAATLAALLTGCSVELGGGSDETATTLGTIPLDAQTNFMNACVGGGSSADFCRCTLDYIEDNFGPEGLVDLDAEVNAEGTSATLPARAQEAFDACS